MDGWISDNVCVCFVLRDLHICFPERVVHINVSVRILNGKSYGHNSYFEKSLDWEKYYNSFGIEKPGQGA